MRIFENADYNFVGMRKYGYLFSAVILLVGIASLAVRGVATGIDFRGGTEFEVITAQPLAVADVREALTPALGEAPEVKEYGGADRLLVRTGVGGDISEVVARVEGALAESFPEARAEVANPYSVGPRFADDLKRGAFFAVIGSLIVIFAYVMLRFHWTYSVGAVAALAHDVLFALGMFSLLEGVLPFSLQMDQTIVAAFLTIAGFSMNDTVVIFDRIREYATVFKSDRMDRLINRAINSTLSRTLVTNGTTLAGCLILFLFGGETLKGFAFALLLGIGIGTYSTIFIAAPIMMDLRNWLAARRGAGRPAVASARVR